MNRTSCTAGLSRPTAIEQTARARVEATTVASITATAPTTLRSSPR